MSLFEITSPTHLQQVLTENLTKVAILYFRADWAEPCIQMDGVFKELANRWATQGAVFLSIEAEAHPEISESFEVDAVPYFILLRGHTLLTRLSGAQPTVLASAIESHIAGGSNGVAKSAVQPAVGGGVYNEHETEEELTKRCQAIMNQENIVLFMKGDRETPRCGFSRKIIDILNNQNVTYTTFDILSDESVRQKLKKLNDWPTYPQLIIKGEFVGGLDIVTEMVETGELAELLA